MDVSFQIFVVIALILFQDYYIVSLVLSLSSMAEHNERTRLQQLQSEVATLTAWMEDQRSKDQKLQDRFVQMQRSIELLIQNQAADTDGSSSNRGTPNTPVIHSFLSLIYLMHYWFFLLKIMSGGNKVKPKNIYLIIQLSSYKSSYTLKWN